MRSRRQVVVQDRAFREPKGLAAHAKSLGDGLRVPEESWESCRV